MQDITPWFEEKKGKVAQAQQDQIREIETRQSLTFERFLKLEILYDPHSVASAAFTPPKTARVTENLVASAIDTVTAVIASTDIRARFMTDDADWSTQRQARLREKYAEELVKRHKVRDKVQIAFKSSAKKGTALLFVTARDNEPCVDEAMIDDIVADDDESVGGMIRSLHRIHRSVDRAALIAEFPDHADAIKRVESTGTGRTNYYRTGPRAELVVFESWRLPVGKKGAKGYQAGRHVKSCGTLELIDEPYHKPFFPVARIAWTERERSFYGIGLGERIAGHQRELNRRNWQIERMLDQNASIVTYIRPADAAIAARSSGPLGTLAICKSDYPHTVAPPAVHGDILNSTDRTKASVYETSGVNPAMAQGTISPGLESGAAVREERTSRTQRFATQEKVFETLFLDTVWLMLDVCKDLGAAAPTISRSSRFGTRKIKWADVDMSDVRVQLVAASTLARTPAGRMQTVLEWAQAGVVSLDEARRLMQHPDLERAMSLYTAALEGVEEALEEIQDGRQVMPEPFDNHSMCVWRGQGQYIICRSLAAPESVLEGLRTYVVQAAWYISQAQSAANDNAMATAAAAMPMPGPAEAPMGAPAQAAFAPTAMQLQAS